MTKTIAEQVTELLTMGFSKEQALEAVNKQNEAMQKVSAGKQSTRSLVSSKVLSKLTVLALGNVQELEAHAKRLGIDLDSEFTTFVSKSGQNEGKFAIASNDGGRFGSKFMCYLSDQMGQTNINLLMESRDRAKKSVKELENALAVAKDTEKFTTALIQSLFHEVDGGTEALSEKLGKKGETLKA